jgi:hypothetical protein
MARSHMHERTSRTYYGEAHAQALLEWLNSRRRKSPGRIETMLAAFSDIRLRKNEFVAAKTIRSVLRESKLRLEPFWHIPFIESAEESPFRPGVYRWKLDRSHSVVEWDPVSPRMGRAEALAMRELLDLATSGALDRVRRCDNAKCGRWFYRRFLHKRFHAASCAQETFRKNPEWQVRRREYMKDLRQKKKLQEQKWSRGTKRKKTS